MTVRGFLLLLALALPGAAFAQPLAVLEQGVVRFVSGGVGLDERAALAAMRSKFNVRFTAYVPRGGNYLADIAVAVRDGAGREVLATTMEGPFLLAALAPGAYSVAAKFADQSLGRRFTVPAEGPVDVYLPFDDPTAYWEKGMEPERRRPPR